MSRLGERARAEGVLAAATVLTIPVALTGIPPWSLPLLFALLTAWSAARCRGSRDRSGPAHLPFLLPLSLALLLTTAQLTLSPNPYYSLHAMIRCGMALVFYGLVAGRGRFRVLGYLYTWSAVEAVVAAWQLLAGAGRPAGTFRNPNLMAGFFLAVSAYCVGTIIAGRGTVSRRETWAHWVLAAAASFMALLPGSRSAVIALVLVWGVMLALGSRRRKLAATVIIAAVLLLPNLSLKRMAAGEAADPFAFSRLDIWEMALAMGQDYPYLGAGWDLFGDYAPGYRFAVDGAPTRYGRLARKPHSDYLRAWAEGGAAGVAILILLLGTILRKAPAAWRQGRAGPLMAVGVLLFQSLFHDQVEHYGLVLLFLWFLALSFPATAPAGETSNVKSGVFRGRLVATVLAATVTVLAVADYSAQRQWNRGRLTAATGEQVARLTEARRELAAASAMNPLHPDIARDLARTSVAIYRLTGKAQDYLAADGYLQQAGRLNHTSAGLFGERANLYRLLASRNPAAAREGRTAAAALLAEVLEREPANVFAMIRLAGLHEEKGDRTGALALAEAALLAEPRFVGAHRMRLRLLQELDPAAVKPAAAQLAGVQESLAGYRTVDTYERQLFSR